MIQRPENLARHELIGLSVAVADSTNQDLAGISGVIVDETRNTFVVETNRGTKRIPKANSSFTFTMPDGQKVKAVGSILISQPENRINKKVKSLRWKL